MPRCFFLFLLPLLIAPAACSQPDSVADLDPAECRLERVVVDPNAHSFQYDSFSPDGSLIAIGWDRGEEARGTYLLDLATGDREEIPELNNGASFSPDSRTFINSVYVDNGKTDIVELDISTRELRVIAPHDEWDWLPSYSPDGSMIVFNSYRTGNSDIYLYDRATGELRRMTDSEAYEAHAQFSPDGKTLVFHRQVGETDYNLVIIDIDTGRETQITADAGEESYPSWAPDGRHVFFSSDRNGEPGKTDIFVATLEGEVLHRLTYHPGKDAYAFVSPDGTYLYYTRYGEPQGVYRMKLKENLDCERI